MFSFISHAFHAVTHFVSHAFHAVTHFVARNWRQILTIAAAVAVGVVVTIATGGLGAPLLLAAAAGGLAAGATGYTVGWLVSPNRPGWSWTGFAKATLISGALAVGTAGLGEVLSPVAGSVVSAVVPDAIATAVPDVVSSAVGNAAVGSAFGAGTQVVQNAIEGRPLGDGVGLAAVVGGGTGALVGPLADRLGERFAAGRPLPVDPEIAARGAGAKGTDYPPGFGGVEPLSPIVGLSRTNLDAWNQLLDGIRTRGPRVLTSEELARLGPGRSSPSTTISSGDATEIANWDAAARLQNDYVRSGQDLSLKGIQELNRTLLDGTPQGDKAGLLRSETGDIVGHGGNGFYYYADPASIPARLDEFLQWYRANENTLPPTELAAEAYQQLVRIHPFINSNGRTTRLVMDWILQRNGLPPATFDGISSEAVHSPTDMLVYNVDQGVLQANTTLTSTSDPTAVPGVTVAVPPPSSTNGFAGALGDANAAH